MVRPKASESIVNVMLVLRIMECYGGDSRGNLQVKNIRRITYVGGNMRIRSTAATRPSLVGKRRSLPQFSSQPVAVFVPDDHSKIHDETNYIK